MLASLALVLGIVLGVAAWAVVGHGLPSAIPAGSPPTRLGVVTLLAGLAATSTFLLGSRSVQTAAGDTSLGWLLASILLSAAATVLGVATLQRGDRRWPSWLGLALGGAPALAWLAFAIGNLVGLGG